MSEARIYAVRNRISEALLSKDGPTADSLVSDADRRVAHLAGRISTFVAAKVQHLSHWADLPEDALFAGSQSIEEPAMNIAEVAEAAGLDAVGSVARGLCVMVDGLTSRGIWHTDALRIHLRALAVVHARSGEPGPANRRIVEELQALRASLGFTD